jgi:GT2 family glycosyltransferase
MPVSVAAIVVTWNRKDLLLQCLRALAAGETAPQRIYVIDNASSDGTPEALRSAGLLDDGRIEHVRLAENTGGAGGFARGVDLAHRAGHDWLWLMDDDCLVRPDSLTQLLAAEARLPETLKPDLLCSRVLAPDGSDHPMNWAAPRWRLEFGHERDLYLRCIPHGVLSIRCCSFVSALIHRRAVDRVGLPRAEFFLWSDDIDFTARVCKSAIGVQVPDSLVDHHTAKYATLDAPPARFFYHLRNQRTMLRDHQAFTGCERRIRRLVLLIDALRWLGRRPLSLQRWSTVLRGVLAQPRQGVG